MQLHQSTVVSGQQSVDFASQAILAGDMDVVVAGGVESISRLKTGSDATPARCCSSVDANLQLRT